MKPTLEVIKEDHQHPTFQYLEVELRQKISHWHYHPHIELTYVLAGSGIRMLGDHIASFKPGDLVMTGENLPHDYCIRSNGQSAAFLVWQFNKDIVSSYPEMAVVSELFHKAKHGILFAPLPQPVQRQLSDFSHYPNTQKLLSLLSLLLLLSQQQNYQLLCSPGFVFQPQATAKLTRLNRTLEFINQHYHRQIQLRELADLTNMTAPSFCRWFRASMQCTLVHYLNKCRIEQAAFMLLHTSKPIAHISLDCGFQSLSSFNRAFQKYKATSPKLYRHQWSV